MTFQRRVALAAAAAVAVAVVAASIAIFLVTRTTLRAQVDEQLTTRTVAAQAFFAESQLSAELPAGVTVRIPPPAELGGARGYAQLLDRSGAVVAASGSVRLPVSGEDRAVAAGGTMSAHEDATVGGTHLRIMTSPLRESPVPGATALQLALPMDGVDSTMRTLGLVLLGLAVGGIALAVALGAAVARAAIGPVRELTETAELVTETADLSHRIETSGSDEVGRLAASFNTMLAALERSLSAQRHLVADASHELRTPLTSLRTNIEVLKRGDAPTGEERTRLLTDVVAQLEELSALVADLVELARGNQPEPTAEDVRLDELVTDAVDRARARWPEARFSLRLEPSVVRGAPDRLSRAVANLLDNAAKYAAEDGEIEVQVRDGALTVRDHGPGIEPADLPHVFDRFFRATNARGAPGSGLGLAIVRQIAESSGGTVTVENAPDRGARFRLALSRAS